MLTHLPSEQTDFAYWKRLIDEAVGEPNPVLCNLKITRVHYLLSRALQQVIGEEAGANFHSWAVWGSRKAGVTIRMEDMEEARRDGTVVGGIVGAFVGLGAGWALRKSIPRWLQPAAPLFGAVCGAATGWGIITWSRAGSAALILAGNRTVLEDIGTQSARFIAAFHDLAEPDPERLETFLAGLRPGNTEDGGQDLLRRTFANYYTARFTDDINIKHEAAYLANCQAVFHEHVRLEPYIRDSMPWIIRQCVTRRLLQFDVGPVRLAVAHDVPTLEGFEFPATLRILDNMELRDFLTGRCGCEDSDDPSPMGSGARDWTRFGERMRYIVHLFRTFHLDPSVRDAPYNLEQMREIVAGRMPAGPI